MRSGKSSQSEGTRGSVDSVMEYQEQSGPFDNSVPAPMPERPPVVSFSWGSIPLEPTLTAWPNSGREPEMVTWNSAPSVWDKSLYIAGWSAPYEVIASAYNQVDPRTGLPRGEMRRDKCGRGKASCPMVRNSDGIRVDVDSIVPDDAEYVAIQMIWIDPAMSQESSDDRFMVLSIRKSA